MSVVRSDAEIIKSYLVSLGAETDVASFTKLDSVLHQTQLNVVSYQIAATAAFAAVGLSVIKYIDHLAQADQQTKMLAAQNMMSVQQYRAVSSALDVMGVSLDDVFFGTKQVQQQFHQLIDDQKALSAMVGPDYERQMEIVRDVHFQLSRLELKAQYFGMKFASDLLKKLGFGEDGIIVQLERLNDWVMEKMPEWSDELSTDIIPVLKEFWGITKDTGTVLKELAQDFTYLIGVFADDPELQQQNVGFREMAKAVQDVVRWVGELVHIMLIAEKGALALTEAIVKGLRDHKMPDFTQHVRKDGSSYFDLWGTGHGGDSMDRFFKSLQGDIGNMDYSKTPSPTKTLQSMMDGGMSEKAMQAAARVSRDTGVPAELIYGQWAHETGNFTNRGAKELNNLAGIRLPGTETYQNFGSVDDFADRYERLLESKRYVSQGVLAATTPESFAAALKRGSYYEGPEKDYAAGIRRYSGDYHLNVTVQTGDVHSSSPEQIAQAARRGAMQAYEEMQQRQMAELNGAYY